VFEGLKFDCSGVTSISDRAWLNLEQAGSRMGSRSLLDWILNG
jgi:hypothetical protein